MASEDFPTDLNGEYIEHHHLLSSDQAQWERLGLIYELEPAGEIISPKTRLQSHWRGQDPLVQFTFN
jgi:AraC family transcriptional regulator